MKNNTEYYYSPKQGRLPLFPADSLDICDPVLAFDQIMEEIGTEQYLNEKLKEYTEKLKEYVEKIRICGSDRNSYSRTDHDAAFMRMKKD